MLELRFHGRGGQGTVNAAQLLAKSLVKNGKYAQFIPAFGVERKGSPVYGYFRLDDQPIRPKNQVYTPNGVVILDESLITEVDVFAGMKEESFVILNTKRKPDEIPVPDEVETVVCVDATALSREHIGKEIPNTVILGALARLDLGIDTHILADMIADKFGAKNAAAFQAGYDHVHIWKKEV